MNKDEYVALIAADKNEILDKFQDVKDKADEIMKLMEENTYYKNNDKKYFTYLLVPNLRNYSFSSLWF